MIPEVLLDGGTGVHWNFMTHPVILKCDRQEIDGHFTKVPVRVSLNNYYVLLCVVHLFVALTAL